MGPAKRCSSGLAWRDCEATRCVAVNVEVSGTDKPLQPDGTIGAGVVVGSVAAVLLARMERRLGDLWVSLGAEPQSDRLWISEPRAAVARSIQMEIQNSQVLLCLIPYCSTPCHSNSFPFTSI